MGGEGCAHHWLVPESRDREVLATCRKCGTMKEMVNSWESILDGLEIEAGGRNKLAYVVEKRRYNSRRRGNKFLFQYRSW